MAKRKSGLGKSISSIFDGSTGPDKDSATRQPDGTLDALEKSSDFSSTKDTTGNSHIEKAYSADDRDVTSSGYFPNAQKKHTKIRQDTKKRFSSPAGSPKKHLNQNRQTKHLSSRQQVSQNRRTSSVVVALLLAFVAVFAWLKVFTGSPAATKTSNKTNAASTVKKDVSPGTITINWERPVEYTLSRNPMTRGTGKTFAMTEQDIIITGIVSSEETGFTAVLSDGSIIHTGDEIHGIKILDIKSKSVEFEKDGRRWTQTIDNR